ncbi:streptomycin 6-kinase [Myxococcus stipitatus DSM 14675]|uniref:Streptomycin 6-kinase n=1 Tax=Myxococcus stipitatus (strain DSM 14675 / JCM 12634 / Mx s8) TaxID=1278073 RepID=L7U6S7_MYXSD|nr:aminoglycoside phosphotransferase family protein [Myxococcus stipitatus]AGC43813.1 streptomycin 6-kinase [Myxococcus stipitatus DSM 14675]
MRTLQIPTRVQRTASSLGPEGEAWLAGLPERVARLEARWAITVGEVLEGGSAAFVARARRTPGEEVVLKVALPDPRLPAQARVLELARGQGYARLLQVDLAEHSLLLEALGPTLEQLALPVERQLDLLCELLVRAWEVPTWEPRTREVAEAKARELHTLVSRWWVQCGRPCSARVFEQALRFAEHRAAQAEPGRLVVAHGDPHPANALRVRPPRVDAEPGFLFIDPDGLHVEPAYDLGVVLRDWCSELLAGDAMAVARTYCQRLARNTGVDAQALWEWGYLERVSTGLYLSTQDRELGRPFLATAELLVD